MSALAAPLARDLRRDAVEVFNERPLAGLAAAVVDGGELRWSLGLGLADAARNRPVDEATVFRIGSLADMALYAAALTGGRANANGRVVRAETLAGMLRPQGPAVGRAAMGLAFLLDRLGGHRVAGHDGGWPGFVSSLLVSPDDGVAALAFTNTSVSFAPHDVAERLLGRMLGLPEEPAPEPVPKRPHLWPESSFVAVGSSPSRRRRCGRCAGESSCGRRTRTTRSRSPRGSASSTCRSSSDVGARARWRRCGPAPRAAGSSGSSGGRA